MAKDWLKWHDAYEDDNSELSQRLIIVKGWLSELINERGTRIISICAGQGNDVIDVLSDTKIPQVSAHMLESDKRNVRVAKERINKANLEKTVNVVETDAGLSDSYLGLVPADIVLACGVFGNIEDEYIFTTIDFLPQCLKSEGSVIWTRSRRQPDITPKIRRYLKEHQFEELDFVAPEKTKISVGVNRYKGEPAELQTGKKIFEFVV